jgi:hypothetical protein
MTLPTLPFKQSPQLQLLQFNLSGVPILKTLKSVPHLLHLTPSLAPFPLIVNKFRTPAHLILANQKFNPPPFPPPPTLSPKLSLFLLHSVLSPSSSLPYLLTHHQHFDSSSSLPITNPCPVAPAATDAAAPSNSFLSLNKKAPRHTTLVFQASVPVTTYPRTSPSLNIN